MYEVPVRFSSDSRSDQYGSFPYETRIGRISWLTRAKGRRSRRYLLYAGLLVGFCILLAFAGCGTTNPIGELTASETSINFGAVAIGQSGSATISLNNGGNAAVIVTQVEITGKPFRLMGSSNFPLTVPAGGTYSFPIQFQPTAAGTVSGEVTVVSDVTTGGLAKVSLSGVGVQVETAPLTQSGVLSGISCGTSSMTGAGTENCFVALNAAAASGGVTVDLSSTNAAFKVPGTVTVPANATGAGFAATVSAVSTYQSGEVTATEGGVSESFAYQLNAAVRILSSSVGTLTFGSVTVNTTSEQSVVLTSTGTEPITISSAALTGNGFSYPGLAVPLILNPGEELILNIQFDPTTAGQWTGQLTIASNNSSTSAMVIGLSGTGEAVDTGGGGSGGGGGNPPAAPASLTCGSASLTGATTDSCTVTLTSAATGSGATVNLTSSSAAVTVPASVTVPAGAVSAGFTATASAVTAAQTANLTATANGGSQTFAIQLNAAGAFLAASPASVAFGDVSLNSLSTQTLTLTSAGTEPVTLSAATLTGAGLTLTGVTLPVTLNPGQSLTLNLGFLPTAAGAVTGQITLTSNATTGGTMVVSVTGTGAIAYAVDLSWAAPSSSTDPVAGYNIYRSPSGAASYQLLNSGVNSSTNFTDDTVESGQSYAYIVTSVDSSGVESAASNTFDVTIP